MEGVAALTGSAPWRPRPWGWDSPWTAAPSIEPVHLAVGEQLGARRAGGVLGGDDRKGLWQGMAPPSTVTCPSSMASQKGGLSAGGGAVQLVGEEQIAQHRAGLIAHFPGGVRHGVTRTSEGGRSG